MAWVFGSGAILAAVIAVFVLRGKKVTEMPSNSPAKTNSFSTPHLEAIQLTESKEAQQHIEGYKRIAQWGDQPETVERLTRQGMRDDVPVEGIPLKGKPTNEQFDALARTDGIGLLDNDWKTRENTAQRLGKIVSAEKVVTFVTEILDGKSAVTHITYANSSLHVVGYSAVTHKAVASDVQSLYRVLQRAMFDDVAQIHIPNEKGPRLRLIKNGVLPALSTMVKAGVIPAELAKDMKRLHSDSSLVAVKLEIESLFGMISLQRN